MHKSEINNRLDMIALECRALTGGAGPLTSERTEKALRLIKEHSLLTRLNAIIADPKPDFTNPEYLADVYAGRKPQRRDDSPHARAFSKWLRNGLEGMSNAECQQMPYMNHADGSILRPQNAQTETGSGGGYLIPQGFSGMLEEALKWYGGIDGVVEIVNTETGNTLPWPTINDTANRGRIVGVDVQLSETDFTFGQVSFGAYIGTSDLVLIPLALMQDAYFDMDALVTELLGTRLGRLFNWKCTTGSGTNEPTGIATAANNAGNVVSLYNDAITYFQLVQLETAVDPAYRHQPTARWMFSDGLLTLLKGLVDANARPLWQPGLTASFQVGAHVDPKLSRPQIMGHEYYVNQDLPQPTVGTSNSPILFGDMSRFKVRQVATPNVRLGSKPRISDSITVMRLVERYADYLQIGFAAYTRFDSNLLNPGLSPVAVGTMAASGE